MIDSGNLSAAPEVGETPAFEDFFHAQHEGCSRLYTFSSATGTRRMT